MRSREEAGRHMATENFNHKDPYTQPIDASQLAVLPRSHAG
jgi:hypothetical protein